MSPICRNRGSRAQYEPFNVEVSASLNSREVRVLPVLMLKHPLLAAFSARVAPSGAWRHTCAPQQNVVLPVSRDPTVVVPFQKGPAQDL